MRYLAPALVAAALLGASSPPTSPYVHRCGLRLCVGDRVFVIHGATAYGEYGTASVAIAQAVRARLNTVEIVEFETHARRLSDLTSEATWRRVDQFIAAAGQRGLRVILNLSSYAQALQQAGVKPTTVDWLGLLTFVTGRVNTVTGRRYSTDPSIAMYELVGEIDAPNYDSPTRGTTAQTTAFFRRTLAELKRLDPNHLASTGGMSYLNDPHSGIDWKTIMSDPNDDVCGVEINSAPDRDITTPAVSSFCRSIGKPWFLAAWSSCHAAKARAEDINDWPAGDVDLAAHAADMYRVERDRHPASPGPAMAAVGSDFWNLGTAGSCAIGPRYPQTVAVVRQYAP